VICIDRRTGDERGDDANPWDGSGCWLEYGKDVSR
jgi:hypothetical protein